MSAGGNITMDNKRINENRLLENRMHSEMTVSIICNCYNHESYIRQTLDSFIMQKTNFAFEVLIHDDASTDRSAMIIREYEEKYPDIVKPIFQTENQYSKKISITEVFQYPRATGKYLAFCEGDDYWIDEYKLQKQVDALERHPDINICTCCTLMICEGKPFGKISPSKHDTIIPPEKVISGGGDFVGTNSILVRRDAYLNNEIRKQLYGFDYYLQVIGSIPNGMLYLSDCMCVYRVGVPGSWTERNKKDIPSSINHIRRVNGKLKYLDSQTGLRYHDTIHKHIHENEMRILSMQHNYKEMRSGEYKNIYKSYPLRRKIRIRIAEMLYMFKKR